MGRRFGHSQRTTYPELYYGKEFQVFFRVHDTYHGPFTAGHETSGLYLHMGECSFAKRGGEEFNCVGKPEIVRS
jgi:hypothetical protein